VTTSAAVYASTSPWNTPISDDAVVHPDSDALVSRFATSASNGTTRRLTSDPTQYTYPVHQVSASTPRRTIRLSGVYSDVVDQTTTRRSLAPVLEVPIPLDAQPSPGTDASIVVWDPATGDEWGFWEFRNEGDGTFSARNGYHYDTRWSGVPPVAPQAFVSRGAGLPYLAGLVRRDEIDAGSIDHALAFAYDYPSPEFTWPATKSDGWGTPGLDVPEGARIRLDPTLTTADLSALGLSEEGIVIARALQRYGMYTIDRAGRPKIMIEDEQTARWQGAITASTVSALPWEAFEVLDWRVPKVPVAVLPGDREVATGTVVVIDGSSSHSPDGASTLVAHEWTAPAGTSLSGADGATPTWDTAGLPAGDYTFGLRVRDARGAWSAPTSITYQLAPPTSVAVLEHDAFGATYASEASGSPWRPLDDEELLVAVALRPARTVVDRVTGNGLTWTRVHRQQDVQGELAVEVWRARSAAPTSGPVHVTTASQAWSLNVQALRLSPATVLASAGSDTGSVDTRHPQVSLAASAGTTTALGLHAGRATPFEPFGGLDLVGRYTTGDAGNQVRTSLLRATVSGPDTVVLGGTQSSALDWVMIGLLLEAR
jgi:hypothetical protein